MAGNGFLLNIWAKLNSSNSIPLIRVSVRDSDKYASLY
jgi:hypothetical protein